MKYYKSDQQNCCIDCCRYLKDYKPKIEKMLGKKHIFDASNQGYVRKQPTSFFVNYFPPYELKRVLIEELDNINKIVSTLLEPTIDEIVPDDYILKFIDSPKNTEEQSTFRIFLVTNKHGLGFDSDGKNSWFLRLKFYHQRKEWDVCFCKGDGEVVVDHKFHQILSNNEKQLTLETFLQMLKQYKKENYDNCDNYKHLH